MAGLRRGVGNLKFLWRRQGCRRVSIKRWSSAVCETARKIKWNNRTLNSGNGPAMRDLGIAELFKVPISFYFVISSWLFPWPTPWHRASLFSSVGIIRKDQVSSIPSEDTPSSRDHELLQQLLLDRFPWCVVQMPNSWHAGASGSGSSCFLHPRPAAAPPRWKEGSQALVVPPGHSSWSVPQPSPSAARSTFHKKDKRAWRCFWCPIHNPNPTEYEIGWGFSVTLSFYLNPSPLPGRCSDFPERGDGEERRLEHITIRHSPNDSFRLPSRGWDVEDMQRMRWDGGHKKVLIEMKALSVSSVIIVNTYLENQPCAELFICNLNYPHKQLAIH